MAACADNRRTILTRKTSASLSVALAFGAVAGLLVPALLVGGLWMGLRDQQQAEAALQRELESRLDVLASSMPELLWNLDTVAAREVVAAIVKSPEVVRVSIRDAASSQPFLERQYPERRRGQSLTGRRDVLRGDALIGQVEVELDDHLNREAVTRQRWLYGMTVSGQLLASLLLVLWLLRSRVFRPLRELEDFAQGLAGGNFTTPVSLPRDDEIGRLGGHLEHMRGALQTQFSAQHALIERLRGMAETVPGVVFQLRRLPQGGYRFDYVSEAIREYFLLGSAELTDSADPWFARIDAADRATVRAALEVSARSLGPWQQEFRTQHGDGSERWMYANAIAQKQLDGSVLWHGFLTDISRQRRDALELERYRHHLEELVQARTAALAEATSAAQAASLAKSAFLANMSHEIRTPMNAIIGLTYLAQGDANEPEQRERLARVAEAAEHLLAIINNVLDFSKIEAGKVQLERREFRLESVLDNVASMVAQSAASKGLRVEVDIAPDLHDTPLLGDPQRITEILLNFAGNAVKFTDCGFVRLSARQDADHSTEERVGLLIEVEDSGIGIDSEAQLRLFRDFEQADSSTTRRYGGTGLGLAICRRLAELMHGSVGLRSSPGQGSQFWLRLRLDRATPQPESLEPVPVSHDLQSARALLAPWAQSRILVAEDNLVNQEVALAMLANAGLSADVASDGREAVEMFEHGDYALVLMDVQMPVMDGLDATRAIRALPGKGVSVPIIAMTANAFDEERQRCIDAGMDDHIGKPVSAEQLFLTLHAWLSGQHEVRGRATP